MTKEEKIEELSEWIVEHMDMSELESYAKQQLEEYYYSEKGQIDFFFSYPLMKEIKGDE